jgi:hypothetical protein
MIERLCASWEVFAGVLPGTAEPEYTKKWFYTEADYEADKANTDPSAENNFTRMMVEASQYAISLTDPRRINWVRTDFIWL